MKDQIVYCALILHYLVAEKTMECVDSLLAQTLDDARLHIVIVDNASDNGSGERLLNNYRLDERVDVLILKESKGFSYGNNYGYKFVKDYIHPDFLLVFNNDIVVKDNLFCEKLLHIYDECNFDILGPDIYVPHKRIHQNPQRLSQMTLEEAREERNRLINVKKRQSEGGSKLQELYRRSMGYFQRFTYARKAWHFLKYRLRGKKDVLSVDYTTQRVNVQLHGSALVFSKSIIDKWENLFWPETAFYYEEYILFERIRRDNLVCIYSPDIQVLHYHEYATKVANKINGQKYGKIAVQRLIDSINIYIDFLEDN